MKIKIFLTIIFLIGFSGCTQDYRIEPKELPDAKVGVQYNQSINIIGGKVIDKNFELKTDLPEDIGIEIHPENDVDGYNIIKVHGIPKYKGVYNINISTGFYGGGSNEINKTYQFKVESGN